MSWYEFKPVHYRPFMLIVQFRGPRGRTKFLGLVGAYVAFFISVVVDCHIFSMAC
jgi:hypothetical protein